MNRLNTVIVVVSAAYMFAAAGCDEQAAPAQPAAVPKPIATPMPVEKPAATKPAATKPQGEPIVVEVFHDTVCPWCRIGMKHLETALKSWKGPPIQVVHRAYLLDSNTPPEGRDLRQHLGNKYGHGRVDGMFARVTRVGRQAGLTFAFDKVRTAPDSSLSHALIAWAPADKRDAVVRAVQEAYFEDGANIGDVEVLVGIGKSVGLDVAAARTALSDPAARSRIKSEVAQTRGNISGVPHFRVGGTRAIQGAVPPDRILAVLQTVADARSATR